MITYIPLCNFCEDLCCKAQREERERACSECMSSSFTIGLRASIIYIQGQEWFPFRVWYIYCPLVPFPHAALCDTNLHKSSIKGYGRKFDFLFNFFKLNDLREPLAWIAICFDKFIICQFIIITATYDRGPKFELLKNFIPFFKINTIGNKKPTKIERKYFGALNFHTH